MFWLAIRRIDVGWAMVHAFFLWLNNVDRFSASFNIICTNWLYLRIKSGFTCYPQNWDQYSTALFIETDFMFMYDCDAM